LNPEAKPALVELRDVREARERIGDRVHRTPTISSTTLGDLFGTRLCLKAELFQRTGSFKPRGVFNKLLSLPDGERNRGVVSLSAGNHAAALAYGAASVGTRATIVMPAHAVPSKVEATRAYGGEVVLTEGDLLAVCMEIQAASDLVLVHPFDDPSIIAGQGTVGLEILEDVPEVGIVVVPVGGGGLISGIAVAIKGQRPGVRITGVEPEGADAMTRSLAQGSPVHLDRTRTLADGLAAPFAGEHTLRHVQQLVDDVVTVSDEDILEALRLVWTRTKLAAEPSGVAGVAAMLAGRIELPAEGTVVAVVSGGNFDLGRLKEIL
jgi:threonine dehydratase